MKHKLLLGLGALAIAGTSFIFVQKDISEGVYTPRTSNLNGFKSAEQFFQRFRANKETGLVAIADVLKARKQVNDASGKRSALGLNWTFKGPDNLGGRTRAILVDRLDQTGQTVWAGAVSGGLYKSTNGAGSWKRINTFNETLVVACIEQAPNGDLYVGTGSSFESLGNASYQNPGNTGASQFMGRGVFKSTDNGATWVKMPSASVPDDNNTQTPEWTEVNRIKVDPANPSRIFAAMDKGLRLSTDGGTSWVNPVYLVEPPTCTQPSGAIGGDIEILGNGVVMAVVGVTVFRSNQNGDDCSFIRSTGLPIGGLNRVELSFSPADPNRVYALCVSSSNLLEGVYQSTDGGVSFTKFLSPQIGYFEPMNNGQYGQGRYDMALQAFPNDPNSILILGVQMWKWNGGLSQVSAEFNFPPIYVHADKHIVEFDPHDPSGKTIYVGTDGGIFKSMDGGNTWFEANRGYATTQFYGIAHYNNDKFVSDKWLGGVFGGTQDNGTQWVPGKIQSSWSNVGFGQQYTNTVQDAININGGDGFDCDASQIAPGITFVSSQNAAVRRNGSLIACENCNGDFYSKVRLWETLSDPNSLDSILFINADTSRLVKVGDGITKTFVGTIENLQEPGVFINGSVFFTFGVDTVEDFDGDGILKNANNTNAGNFDYSTGDYDVTFLTPPSLNTSIFAYWAESYSAGDTLQIPSDNATGLTIEHILTSNINPGDTLLIQDKIQSLLAVRAENNATWITRDGLNLTKSFQGTDPIEWWSFPAASGAFCYEFSEDGDHLFVGRGGVVTRISGLNNVYDSASAATANANATTIFTSSAGNEVTGISVHPTDPETLLVTLGNYGYTSYVKLVTNAVSATVASSGLDKQGDLPLMPVYDGIVDMTNPEKVIIGTEYGMWATDDIFATSPTWTDETSLAMGPVPVFAVKQQRKPYYIASNHEVIYIGTHGRGIWKSDDLVGINDEPIPSMGSKFITELLVYPNPMTTQGFVTFNLKEGTTAELKVYDLQGRMVVNLGKTGYSKGNNKVLLNTNKLGSGTYFVTLETDTQSKVAKFIVNK